MREKALAPIIDYKTVDSLKPLLLNREAKRNYKKSKTPVTAPLSSLLGGPIDATPVANFAHRPARG